MCEFFIALLHVRLTNCSSSSRGAAAFSWFTTNPGPVAIYNNIWLLHVWHFHNDRLIILLKRTQRHKSKAKLNPDSLNRQAQSRSMQTAFCPAQSNQRGKKTHTPTALRFQRAQPAFEWSKTKRMKWKIEGKFMHKSNRVFSFSELELIIRWRVQVFDYKHNRNDHIKYAFVNSTGVCFFFALHFFSRSQEMLRCWQLVDDAMWRVFDFDLSRCNRIQLWELYGIVNHFGDESVLLHVIGAPFLFPSLSLSRSAMWTLYMCSVYVSSSANTYRT